MPYIKRSVPQALNLLDAGVEDVFSSPNVYANNVPIALYDSPILGNAPWSNLNLPPDPPVLDYPPSQAQLENYLASEQAARTNPIPIEILGGPGAGQTANIAQGEPPAVGTTDPNDLVGNPGETTTAVVPPTGDSIQARIESYLNKCLEQHNQGLWKETGRNPLICDLWVQIGIPQNAKNDQTPWCAAFVSNVLKAAGAPYVPHGAGAIQYRLPPVGAWKCTPVPVNDPTQWRRNDVISITWNSGGNHVAFIWGVDLQKNLFAMIGGNQGDDFTCASTPGIGQIKFVGRSWTIDPQFDKPIITDLVKGQIPKTR